MTTSPPILVLGATGTTGRRVTAELIAGGATVRAASRNPRPVDRPGVTPTRFDWDDPATHGPALDGAAAVYLMAPPADPRPETRLEPFLARAADAGVTRIVLLSASAIRAGDPGLGQVHAALAAGGAEWAVLRPSWFMQNLWNPAHQVGAAVRADREVVTATGTGRIAFIDAGDIARVAAHALTDPAAPNRELVLTGPEALSYDDVAARLTRAVGRPVHHRSVTPAEAAEAMARGGMPPAFAELLAGLDATIADGAEDRVTDTVSVVTGREPRSLHAVLNDDHPFEEDSP